MERKFLEELGLEKESIDKIMAENGKDIEKAKGDLSTKETELETLQGQLKAANEQIEEFKEMDVEKIKAAADEYKTKYEEAQNKAKQEMEKLQFEHKLEGALSGAKAKNIKAVKALLDMEGLKLNKDEIVGLNDQLEKLKEENDYLFESEETTSSSTFIRPGNTNKNDKSESLGARLARKVKEN
ncbi:phage scaffolding protein [Senegalia massiliensis]|uniref:Phage minor structural protein GP20 n=1 Tax=Senegalia massiliensis TaxID=1720316 RepID=A0A845R261_9CLOT|nr:phage scaffolding protein [Senegalia massiliensis]NBI08069.1 hypothetical protein [Senegalia massiliensis]